MIVSRHFDDIEGCRCRCRVATWMSRRTKVNVRYEVKEAAADKDPSTLQRVEDIEAGRVQPDGRTKTNLRRFWNRRPQAVQF